jgi:hypothetical protein
VLDIRAVNRFRLKTQLEAVVLRGIVRAGYLNSADYVELVLRPVRDRRRDDADVDHIDTAAKKSGDKRAMKGFSAGPVVAPNRERSLDSPLSHERRVCSRDRRRCFFREIATGDPADVVLAKDVP